MKKLISIFNAFVLTSIASTAVISCDGKPGHSPPPIEKTDLSTITQLSGLKLVANGSKSFKNLDITIATTAEQFKNKTPLFGKVGFNINYYLLKDSNKNIAEQNQKPGNFWIVISVAACDIYWKGQTTRLKITLT